MNASSTSTAELARLGWRLGIAYSEAVAATLQKYPTALDLIGCHGQTLYHQPQPAPYAGRRFACTWQAGEAQVLASALGGACNLQTSALPGHAGWWPGRATCSTARLHALRPSTPSPRPAEHWRHRQPYGHPCGGHALRRDRIRQWSGQHADRCARS